tara:strand:- start:126 stop:848 length:723 start_codon:yes stop_codon:yes gene_type:complete
MDTAAIIRACNLLEQAEVKSYDLLSSGSNYVFISTMVKDGTEIKAIYKPRRGEVPLWDFPDGTLYRREYAAFMVSQALKWDLIPPTVIRDGPFGIGSMQWFVGTMNRVKHCSQTTNDLSALKQVALFDYLVNNADRKAGHFLEDEDGRLWVVDHGLTFNTVPKLRTVLWDFSGQTVPKKLLADVKILREKLKHEKQLSESLHRLLEAAEVKALESRINKIIEKPVFAYPESRRSVPWSWI